MWGIKFSARRFDWLMKATDLIEFFIFLIQGGSSIKQRRSRIQFPLIWQERTNNLFRYIINQDWRREVYNLLSASRKITTFDSLTACFLTWKLLATHAWIFWIPLSHYIRKLLNSMTECRIEWGIWRTLYWKTYLSQRMFYFIKFIQTLCDEWM